MGQKIQPLLLALVLVLSAHGKANHIVNVDKEYVTVAVIDSGAYSYLIDRDRFVYYDGEKIVPYDFHAQNQDDIFESYNPIYNNSVSLRLRYHGTMVANTITQNSSESVRVLPIRITDSYYCYDDSSVREGIERAISYGVDAICIPIATKLVAPKATAEETVKATQNIYREEILKAYKANIPVVVAAGNESTICDFTAPADIDECITVSATDEDGTFADYSNHGRFIDFCACGIGYTCGLGTKDGTSYSAPRVAAAVASAKIALLKKGKKRITCDMIYRYLQARVIDKGDKGFDEYYGCGFLDLDTFPKPKLKKYY